MWVRSLSAKFLTCRFALVEYQTIQVGARDGSDENKKKKERKINVLGSCTKTFNLTHSRDTSLETLHPRARRFAFRYTRVTFYERLWAPARMHADAARCDLRVVGYYRRVSGDEWKSTLGTRNNTRFAHLECILSVCSTVWFVRGIPWCNKRVTETSSGLLECEENILTYTGYAGCNRPRFLIIDRADAF